MSTGITHRERYGRTKNWRGTAVYVEREADLSDDLSEILDVVVKSIILRCGDGYQDAVEWKFDRRHAVELHEALGAALTATERAPEPLAEWERELLAGEEAS